MSDTGRVRVRGVGFLRGRTRVLEGVDLDADPGEVVALCGPNGGGKSTLLLLLAGLLRPSAGTLHLGDTPAHALPRRATGAVGLITAEPGLYPLLTGRENLHFFGGLYGLSPAEVDRRATPFAERLGVGEALDRPVDACSSGMRQKLSLARALLMDPPVLLLDEPTANLDPLSAATIHAEARALADAGRTVVLVTHDLPLAESIADRAALLDRTVVATVSFSGARTPPPEGPLLAAWRQALGRA